MVLNRRVAVAGLFVGLLVGLLASGCTQSLFDNSASVGDSPGSDSVIVVPDTCPSPCLADAAADFTTPPAGMRWRYLDDHRNRTWTAMTGDATTKTGADPANRISSCLAHPDNSACRALPGALLVASSGATSPADPAIELTVTTAQVIQLNVRAQVAGGADQQLELYRNSREDVLFTGIATSGTAFEHAVRLDALAGDRFLLAVVPGTNGAEVAVQMFANPTGAKFPSGCQIAMSFAAASGNTIDNLCGGTDFTHKLYDGDRDTPPALAAGPFAELGNAADLVSDAYFEGLTVLDKSRDITVQFWVKLRAFVEPYDAWLFSDLDLNTTGGLGINIINRDPPQLDVVTTLTATQTDNTFLDALAPYPTDKGWHFVRVVHSKGNLDVCIDGQRKAGIAVPAGFLRSSFVPYLGKNVVWTPSGAHVDGELDDVRVLTGALPCE